MGPEKALCRGYSKNKLLAFPPNTSDEEYYNFQERLTKDERRSTYNLKVYATDGDNIGYRWKWPFFDIIFLKNNGTHICTYDIKESLTFTPKTAYPLMKWPLGGMSRRT